MNQAYKKGNKFGIRQIVLSLTFLILAAPVIFLNSAHAGAAHLIFNNSAGKTEKGIFTNLNTATSENCSKEDALYAATCNSFALGDNEIQILQSDGAGNLINQIGVNNDASTSYNNKGTSTQLNYFVPGEHLFDMDKFRNASDAIGKLSPGLPKSTYGTISYKEFINNVANARPMYGIVRVKIPLVKTLKSKNKHREGDDDDHHEGDDDDHDKHDSDKSDDHSGKDSKTLISIKSSEHREREREEYEYRFCGEKPTPECLLCGPDVGTDIKPGSTICGIKLGSNAQALVYGSLFFDWVDCKTEKPLTLNELPEQPRDIYFSISVPVNVNPANTSDSSGTMDSLDKIPGVIGPNKCSGISPCSIPVTNPIPFNLVSEESKSQYQYETNTELNGNVFSTLTKAQQFSLLFPSGYETGWEKAFNSLGISPNYWRSLGFDTAGSAGFIDINQIRASTFEDIPAYMYTGGLVDLHYHTNISGLIYVPQAIEIEQKGFTTTSPGGKECHKEGDDDDHEGDDDDHKDHHDSDKHDSSSSHKTSTTIVMRSGGHEESDDDDKEHDDDDKCEESEKDDDSGKEHMSDSDHHDDDDHGHHGGHQGGETIVSGPTRQYINGAILVRDSFYIEAMQSGAVTIINNDPNTYSNIKLSTGSSQGGKFQVFPTRVSGGSSGSSGDSSTGGGSNGGGSGSGSSGGSGSGSSGSGSSGSGPGTGSSGGDPSSTGNPGNQWIEIRPQ